MRSLVGLALLGLIVGCGGDGSDAGNVPAEATAMQEYVESGVTLMVQRLGGLESFYPFLLSPGSPGAGDLQFDPDPSQGAPPFSYIFSIPVDGNWDGIDETTVAGNAAFNGDPASAAVGFGGHVDLTMATLGGLGNFDGGLDFTLASTGRQMSGSGVFSEVVSGNATTLTVNPAGPLEMSAARGTGDSVANACGYSLAGDVQLDVVGPTGALSSSLGFAHNRSSVAMTGATFTDTLGVETALPDTDFVIDCAGSESINDWAGVFTQNWACLPPEFGQATLTITVASATTISISDEDPPGSGDVNVYQATLVPGNPHVVKGFFIAGPSGNTYREDFTWTLASDGSGFWQISSYAYQEGPSQGFGGLCGAKASLAP